MWRIRARAAVDPKSANYGESAFHFLAGAIQLAAGAEYVKEYIDRAHLSTKLEALSDDLCVDSSP